MPAEFQFTLDDMFDDGDGPILAEMAKGRSGGLGPLKTTRSMEGTAGNLSILSMNQVLMGYPLYNSKEDALSMQEAAMAHLLTGSAASPEVDMNTANYKGELLVPDDIMSAAKALKPKIQAKRKTSTNSNNTGGYGNEAILVANAPYPIMPPSAVMPYNAEAKVGIPTEFGMIMPAAGVPDDVFTHKAMQGTIQDPNSLAHVALFVQLLANQEGDPYNNTGQEVRGITLDPNPGSFDCSGYIAWATQQLHLGAGGERLNPGIDIFTGFSLSRMTQLKVCQQREVMIDIEMAKRTKGALIWPDGNAPDPYGHIGVSCGDGINVLEATGNYVGRHDWGYQGGSWAWRVGALNPFINYRVFVPYDTSKGPNPNATTQKTPIQTQNAGDLAPGENWGNFSRELLKKLNAPVSRENVDTLLIWFLAEQPPNQPNGRYNPLNIQLNDSYQYTYGGFAAGVEAVRNELAKDGPFNPVREGLQNNSGHVVILTAIANTPWAYSRYDPEYKNNQGYPGNPARGAAKLIGWFASELPGRREELENGRLA